MPRKPCPPRVQATPRYTKELNLSHLFPCAWSGWRSALHPPQYLNSLSCLVIYTVTEAPNTNAPIPYCDVQAFIQSNIQQQTRNWWCKPANFKTNRIFKTPQKPTHKKNNLVKTFGGGGGTSPLSSHRMGMTNIFKKVPQIFFYNKKLLSGNVRAVKVEAGVRTHGSFLN